MRTYHFDTYVDDCFVSLIVVMIEKLVLNLVVNVYEHLVEMDDDHDEVNFHP